MLGLASLGTAPFPPKESVLHSDVDYSNLLGKLYFDSSFVYKLVKLDESGGANIQKKALTYVSRSSHTVKRCTAKTDRIVGVGPATMDVATTPDASYVLMIVAGRATVNHGDDHSASGLSATRMWAVADDDADKGKIRGVTSPTPANAAFGRYVSGTAADDADMVVELELDDDNARMAFPFAKVAAFAGRNGAGAITATGLVVGERLIAAIRFGTATGTLASVADGVVTQPDARFEGVVTVADQLQQASASDLSGVWFLAFFAPATT